MDNGTIAKRYAKALLLFARKHGDEEAVFHDTATLVEGYRHYESLHRIISDRILDNKKKEEIIFAFFDQGVSASFKRFVQFAIEQDRESLLALICLDYQELYRQQKKLLNVYLTSAVPLAEETQQRLTEKLQAVTNETVCLHARLDPSLIGGFVARWDTYRLDAGVATKLKRIQERLTEKMN